MLTNFKTKLAYLVLCLILTSLQLSSQSNTTSLPPNDNFNYNGTHTLLSVTFHAPTITPGNWIVIRSDDDLSNISGLTSTVAYDGITGETKPIAYVSSSRGSVGAKFSIDCSNNEVYVRGEGPEGYNLPVQALYDIGGGQSVYAKADFTKSFPYTTVRYFENFEISWFMSSSPNFENEEFIGTSINPLYVTHKPPIVASDFQPFHTLLHLGCSNANNKMVELEIVDACYSEFTDQNVKVIGSTTPIGYWVRPPLPEHEPACWTTAGLLKFNDGRCEGWARFFIDILRLQGIPLEIALVHWYYLLSAEDNVTFESKKSSFFGMEAMNVDIVEFTIEGLTGNYSQFHVKNWDVPSSNTFYISPTDETGTSTLTLLNGNTISTSAELGVPAQGNADPRSEFNNHAIVKYGTSYYDASYGTTMSTNKNIWETKSLDGFGGLAVLKKLVGLEYKFYLLNWIGHLNDTTLQCSITP